MAVEPEGEASRPAYVEAWPRLHMQDVAKAALQDLTLSVYTNERGLRVGYALVADENDGTISLNYRIEAARYLQAGRGTQLFALHMTPGLNGSKIAMTDCPLCSRRVRICVFVSGWGCSKCHGLTNRSNSIDHIAAMHKERDDLNASLALGRVRYERQAAFDAKRARLAVLNRKLASRPRREPIGAMTHEIRTTYVDPAIDEFYQQDLVIAGVRPTP